MIYKVNGKEVEYLNIIKEPNGDIIVEYDEKFNLVNAHMGVIMQKLRDNGLKCHVFKELKYNIILIWLNHIEDIHGILHSLNIPHGCYDVNYNDMIVTIDVPIYEQLLSSM